MTSDADVLEAINVDTFPDGATVSLEAVFGNTVEYDSAGDVTSARAMTQVCYCFKIIFDRRRVGE